MNIARSRQNTSPPLPLPLFRSTGKTLHNKVLGMMIASTARPELREYAAILQQRAALTVCLLFLILVTPVLITEHEVGLAGQRKQRDLVQDRVQPQSLDDVLDIALVVIAACILCRGELDIDLFGGFEVEGFEEGDVRVV
jgi:hypothetical protein